MKKLLGTILALALMLAFTGQAQASSNVGNVVTGPNSVNVAKLKNIKITKTATLQGAFVLNNVNSIQGTGGNQTNGNTVAGGGSTSGGAANGVGLTNNVNSAKTVVETSEPAAVANIGNGVTGPSSTNIAKVKNVSVTKTATVQVGVVLNNVSSVQGTGGNQTNGNTVVGGGSTSGDASSTMIIDNNVNSSTTIIK